MWSSSLFLLGIETIVTLPGGGYGKVVIHADYTHSLLGALVLSAAFGAVAWWRWDRRLGLLLGGVAFSHWVLDLIVHRADLPILPGNTGDLPLLGFGLWRVPLVSIPLEAALLLLGVLLYWRAARSVGPPPRQPGDSVGCRWSFIGVRRDHSGAGRSRSLSQLPSGTNE